MQFIQTVVSGNEFIFAATVSHLLNLLNFLNTHTCMHRDTLRTREEQSPRLEKHPTF